MSAIFELPVRVYIEDTDAQGIVYYVNYLKYMERARSEWLRHHGFPNPAFGGDDSIFVVHSLNVRYHRPARLYDDLVITAFAAAHGRAWFEVEQSVHRGGELLCAGQVKVACADRCTMKPVRMPGAMLERIFANA